MKIERKKNFTFLPRVKREEPVFGNEGVYKFFKKTFSFYFNKKKTHFNILKNLSHNSVHPWLRISNSSSN